MHTVKSGGRFRSRFQGRERAIDNTRQRWIFDSVVWAASLLFAFGLLMECALAKEEDKGVPIPVASCKAERAEIHWHAAAKRAIWR